MGALDYLSNGSIAGTTAGILGFGGIGQAVARLLVPFGVGIEGINSSGQTEQAVKFIGTLTDLERVLRNSDLVIVCLPLNKHTTGLIGSRELGWMKSDAILINALEERSSKNEPCTSTPATTKSSWLVSMFGGASRFEDGTFHTDYPILDLPNVIGSPHNSGHVPGVDVLAVRNAAENVRAFLETGRARGFMRRDDYI